MNAEFRCFSVVVLLLALMGCGSDSKPPAGNDTTATLVRGAIKDQVDATMQEKTIASPTLQVTADGRLNQTEKAAVDAIEKMGGSAGFATDFGDHLFYASLANTKVSDAGLVHLKGLTILAGLDISNTQVSDGGMVHLNGLSNLDQLSLSNTTVGDIGLVHLKGIANLRSLDLNNTEVSDAGLAHLKGLTKLELLFLSNTRVSDAGLVHLKGLTKLINLGLTDTTITDAGLEHLKGLTELKALYLGFYTKVTDKGVKGLQAALPHCWISRD